MEQIIALVIFVVMFVLIVMDKIERHIVTLSCGLLTLALVFGLCMRSPESIWNSLALADFVTSSFWCSSGAEEASSGINWATITFIAGMMVMVEGMAHAGFFGWLCMRLAKAVNYKLVPLMIAFMVMSAVWGTYCKSSIPATIIVITVSMLLLFLRYA